MKSKWPTLAGRLKHAPSTELEALEQLAKADVTLSPAFFKRLEKLREKKKKDL